MKQLVFLGDSITDSDHSFEPENLGYGYVRFIHQAVQTLPHPYHVINKGFDGFTISALKRLWTRDHTALSIDLLTILIGINDVGVIHNTGCDETIALNAFEETYRHLLNDIKKDYDGPVIIMEPFLFPQPERYLLRFDTLKKVNQIIRKICKDYNVYFLPLWDDLLNAAAQNGMNALTVDGIHLTAYGHQLLAEKWFHTAHSILEI